MMLIGLTGKARAGKDTVGDMLVQRYSALRRSFASPLKKMLSAGLGLHAEDFETTEQKEAVIPRYGVSYRHLAQTLGTEWGRVAAGNDLWVDIQRHTLGQMAREPFLVVYTDTRFDNEAALIRDMGGTVVHVLSLRESGLSDKAKAHASEKGVKFCDTDRILENYGTLAELAATVEVLFESLVCLPGAVEAHNHV